MKRYTDLLAHTLIWTHRLLFAILDIGVIINYSHIIYQQTFPALLFHFWMQDLETCWQTKMSPKSFWGLTIRPSLNLSSTFTQIMSASMGSMMSIWLLREVLKVILKRQTNRQYFDPKSSGNPQNVPNNTRMVNVNNQ